VSREARGRRRAFAVLTLGPTSMATCLLHCRPRDGEAPCTVAQRLRYGMFLPPPPMGRHAGRARAAVGLTPLSGAKRIATLARSGQQACAGTCALRHHSRHNSAPALPPPSDDVRWGQSTPASSLIAREARPLAAASDLRRRLDRRWPRWRPTSWLVLSAVRARASFR